MGSYSVVLRITHSGVYTVTGDEEVRLLFSVFTRWVIILFI